MPKYNSSEKQAVLARYLSGKAVSVIASDTGVSRSTIYSWVKKCRTDRKKEAYTKHDIQILERKIVRLQGIIEILKKVECSPNDPLEVKLPELESLQGQYSVHMLCEALDVPRGTYYNYIYRNKRDNSLPWSFQHKTVFFLPQSFSSPVALMKMMI